MSDLQAASVGSDATGLQVSQSEASQSSASKRIQFEQEEEHGDRDPRPEKSLNKWHNFESQYSLALEQSVMIEREAWGSQVEFLMSCIASAVGLGNIWRFPFICGQNGGGAFLIPYLIVLTIVGRPLYMLELGLGQFVSGGPVKIWEMVPGFRGVGYGATIGSFFLASFYCCIMGWAILYFIYSFFPALPWTKDVVSVPGLGDVKIEGKPDAFFGLAHLGEPRKADSATDFALGKGLDGPPVMAIALALLVAWMIIWGVMAIGVSGSGKAAYFTALFPYFVLVVLLIAGCTLDGATRGLKYFYTPQFEKILDPRAWFQAVGQCFFSLGITFGGAIMFASFNKFHHKLGREIVIIGIMDTFTSLLAGTCLFMLLGYLDYKNEQDLKHGKVEKRIKVEDLAEKDGAGMAFVTFPTVLTAFGDYPGPNVFSCLFFFMIIVLAVGSANGIVGTIVTVVCDAFPKYNRRVVLTVLCLTMYFMGLIYTCRTGNKVIDLVDTYGTVHVVYMMAIFEAVGIIYVYGLYNICNDFEFMMGSKIGFNWTIPWAILPFILISILIRYLVTFKPIKHHPTIATVCGWILTGLCWMVLPVALALVVHTRKSHLFIKRLGASFYPTRKWGPKDPAIREAWRRWKKTKPVEFAVTHKVMVALRLRRNSQVIDPSLYWSSAIGTRESMYQTTTDSETEIVPSSPSKEDQHPEEHPEEHEAGAAATEPEI